MIKKIFWFSYGMTAYTLSSLITLYEACFLVNACFSKTIDQPFAEAKAASVTINLALITFFGFTHSMFARPWFKAWISNYIPKELERSNYVLISALSLAAVMALWQPISTPVIWSVQSSSLSTALMVGYWFGWALMLGSTYMIDHFELFGLKQIYCYLTGKTFEPTKFKVVYLYKWVRHPMMLGFLILFWSVPHMTLGHLIFSASMSGYILLGTSFEEKAFTREFGEAYLRYKRATPKFIPFFKFGSGS